MFWQFYILGATGANAIDNVIDKIAIVGNKAINPLKATFFRVAFFTLASALVGISGIFGKITFFFSLPILALAILSIVGSYSYTYLLKNIEISSSGILSYLTPFFFLLSDIFIFRLHIGYGQMIGIILLMLGAIVFVFDFRKLNFNQQFTPAVWGIFAFNLLLSGLDNYLFKHYNNTIQLNEISYILSTWFLVTFGLFFLTLLKQKSEFFKSDKLEVGYIKKVAISKSIDTFSSLLWFKGLTLATLSQVDAMDSFYPLILIILIFIAQKIFKLNVEEDLTLSKTYGKIIGAALLVIGGILAA